MHVLIDKQAAIDTMCSACGYNCNKSDFVYNAPQDEQVILCPEHYALTVLPPAQPERKKGVWKPIVEANEFGEPYQAGVYCSRCGERNTYEPNFCPHCGADMRGEQE